MRLAILALVLAGPVAAQVQSTVTQIDEIIDLTAPHWPAHEGTDYSRPVVPGQMHTVYWDLQVTVTGNMTATNTSNEPGHYTGTWSARVLRQFLDFYGFVNGSVASGVLQPGESQQFPITASAHLQSYAPEQWFAETPSFLATDFWRYEHSAFTPWTFHRASGGESGFWYDPTRIGFSDLQIHITGTLTWNWTPDIAGAIDICPGDGIQRIGLHGDWSDQVTAYSNHIGNYTMLFMGDYWATPNSSFCIGNGQRINPSLRFDAIWLDWMDEMVVSGQTYTLQAVHRWGIGEVRFSNAILFQPL